MLVVNSPSPYPNNMKSNYKIVIIDDNTIDQIITKQLLLKTLKNIEITTVNNGKEGIQWLSNYKKGLEDFLIILLDIKMPEMDGFEFLSEYERFPEELKRGIEIFMLSSTLDSDDIQKANDNKYVKQLLTKPLPIKEFSEMMDVNFSIKQ